MTSHDVVLTCCAVGVLWVLVDFSLWLLWPELWTELHRKDLE